MPSLLLFSLAGLAALYLSWRVWQKGRAVGWDNLSTPWDGNSWLLVALSIIAALILAAFLLVSFQNTLNTLLAAPADGNSQLLPALLFGIGALVLFLGLVSERLKRSNLSAPLIAMVAGILVGPAVLDWVDPGQWARQSALLEHAARLTLGISLMSAAQRLPGGYFRRNWRDPAVMLGLVMPLMWLISSLLVYLFLHVSPWQSLLIGAVLAPTDPVVASGIVTGRLAERHLPERLRDLLTAESGGNDGLAYLFVMLPIIWLSRPPGQALAYWFLIVLGREVLVAVLLGALIGYSAGWLLQYARRHKMIEQPHYLAYTLALTLLTLGLVRLLHSDAILAVFVCGLLFQWWLPEQGEADAARVTEVAEPFFTLPIFALFGATLPWAAWLDLGWPGLLLVLAILLLRRLPLLAALSPLLEGVRSRADTWLLGWFGPVGIGALFYANLVLLEGGPAAVWHVASLVIAASILVHGLSSTRVSRLYFRSGARAAARRESGGP